MEIKFFFVFLLLIFGQPVQNPLFAQSFRQSLDSLGQLPIEQFDNWLTGQINNTKKEDFDLISSAICVRLSNKKDISESIIVQFLQESLWDDKDKVRLIDSIVPHIFNNKVIIDLLHIKIVRLEHNSPKDSVLMLTYFKLGQEVEKENIELLKIRHHNYLDMANIYLNTYENKNKAEEYFTKVSRYPFNLLEGENANYFENLYIEASIGRIKCRSGNYLLLKELSFIPATFPSILPTYEHYIKSAGGRCDICEDYRKKNNAGFIKYDPATDDDKN